MAQSVGGYMALKQHEMQTEYQQLHDRGTQRYTAEEIAQWPNKTVVFVSSRVSGCCCSS